MNNEEVRPTANLVISKSSASDYLSDSNPNLEKLTTQYYETFSITGRFTGYFSNISIGDFYNNLSDDCSSPTAILGGLNATARKENSEQSTESEKDITNPEDLTAGTSTIEGKRGTENFGLAIFKDDKFYGDLTAIESMCHLLLQNKVDSCIISIDNPISEKETQKIELQLFPRHNSKINVSIKNDIPKISIKLDLNADIVTLDKDIDYKTNDVLTKISDTAQKYLTEQFNNYLNKVCTEYETDIDNFCSKATSNFLTLSDWGNFNWNKNFKNAKFDLDINVNVLSSMLITKT